MGLDYNVLFIVCNSLPSLTLSLSPSLFPSLNHSTLPIPLPPSLPHRYGELIVRGIFTGHNATLKVLRRDTTLLRFFHAFVITAPQIIIHLYTVTVATDSTHPDHNSYSVVSMGVLLPALGACAISLVYSLATYVTSDRLTSKTRRVILPAHLTLFGWYACLVVSRILAITLFSHAFGYYVLLFVAAHWVLSVFGILNQKGEFCADYSQQPKKPRWWLEVPFGFYAACLYQFVFFSVREGKTRYAVSVYLVVTLIENSIMVAMFFTEYRTLWYAPASIAVVIGLFLLGALLLAVYYVVLHPDKTRDWYWIGVPKKCCALPSHSKGKSYRPHTIEISQPTLVNMNGQATNISVRQTRSSGLHPLTNILSRNKTTGQMQLTAPPQVIDSGLTSSGTEDYYKKPRIHIPPQSSLHVSTSEAQSQSSSQYHIPNNAPSGSYTSSHTFQSGSHTPNHTLPGSHTPSHTNANETVQILKISTTASLGSSAQSESDDVVDSVVPESDPTIEPSQHSMGLHMDSQLQSAFQALDMNVPILNQSGVASGPDHIRDNANASNANRYDRDIDSPFTSPYDTLDKARKEVLTLKDTEMILEVNEINEDDNEGGRYSASPPNLPTPDFTDHTLIPGCPPNNQIQDQIPLPTPIPMNPHQKIPLPPAVPLNNQSVNPPGTKNLTSMAPQIQPQGTVTSQLEMFQGIPAKRDYHTNQPSKLEQHYFPEPSSHSTPNLPATASRGAKISTSGVPQSNSAITNSSSRGLGSESQHQHGPSINNLVPPVNIPPPSPIKLDTVKNSNYSPERTRGRRGGRGRGGNRNNIKKDRKTSHQPQSYYAYGASSSKPPSGKQNVGRPHSFHLPQVAAENRQKLFGRTIPSAIESSVAHGNTALQSPWQQKQRSTMPVHVHVPVQKPNRSPDRSKPAVSFQPNPGQTPMRPRSYSEGTTLESSQSQERHKSGSGASNNQQILAPQYSQHFLGRSPGAPRRGPQQNTYFVPTDRTQVLNLTWTSPRLHHDPAVSGGHGPSNNHQQQQLASNYGNGGVRHNHAPFLKQRSQTAYQLGGSHGNHDLPNNHGGVRVNPTRKMSNPLQPAGGGGYPHSARKISTNQNAEMTTTNPLLHIPAQSSHTSRV